MPRIKRPLWGGLHGELPPRTPEQLFRLWGFPPVPTPWEGNAPASAEKLGAEEAHGAAAADQVGPGADDDDGQDPGLQLEPASAPRQPITLRRQDMGPVGLRET